MKTFFITVSLILSSLVLLSQNYLPLVEKGATWINYYGKHDSPLYFAHRIEDDTIINNLSYSKVYGYNLENQNSFPLEYTSRWFAGLIREDLSTKKVYGINGIRFWDGISSHQCQLFAFTEFLLYDFGLSIGDTLNDCNLSHHQVNSAIINETQEFLFGKQRRVLTNEYGLKLIEGIGYDDGLFMEAHTWLHAGWGLGMLDYCNTIEMEECQLITTIEEIDRNSVEIFPNPAIDKISIQTNDQIKNAELLNISGQLISGLKKSRTHYDLPSQISSGIYLLKIEFSQRTEVFKIHIANN